MRKVLIVSPHFPPVNAADHQRVRMSLPYLKEFGWSATVLAVRPDSVEGAVIDPLLHTTVPAEVPVERVRAILARLTRLLGLGNLAIRALPNLWRAGNRLLRDRDFDLVYFSTTQFPVMILGPMWKRKFGVPYVVDFQDPWLDDYYERTATPPPGGKTRHSLSRLLAGQLEPRVMQGVSEVISVSPSYIRTLQARYRSLEDNQCTVLPFGAAEKDFKTLEWLDVKQSIFDPHDGKRHWVYIGRAGHDMAPALRLLFGTLHTFASTNPARWGKVQMHFVGTSYAPADRAQKTVEPIAVECGVADVIEERTGRIPYFEALKTLTEADALLVIGSDSPSYSASKLYPYMLAQKPTLAILHRNSPGVQVLRECGAAEIVSFDPASAPERSSEQMAQALQRIYSMVEQQIIPQINQQALGQYSAREMTGKQCAVWDRAVAANVT